MIEPDRIECMDAVDGLKSLSDGSVDLIVTDPPYNIASRSKLTMRGARVLSTAVVWGAWDTFEPGEYDAIIGRVLDESYRVLKPGGALYMFTAREDNGFFIREAVKRGFTYRNQIALIRKCVIPSFGKRNWRSAFELCLYVTKGRPATFNFLSQAECLNIEYYHPSHKRTAHPTEKPLAVIRRIVAVSSNPGDLVVDPFVGSGTTAAAARELGRRYIGFDSCEAYVTMARDRLAQVRNDEPSRPSGKQAA